MDSTPHSRAAESTEYETGGDNILAILDRQPSGVTRSGASTTANYLDDSDELPVLTKSPPTPKPVPAPRPNLLRRLIRALVGWACRMLRRTVALGLLLLALWFWALPFFFPVTSRAVVNARIVQVRAPIGGEVTALAPAVGDRVAEGEAVMRVTGRNVEISHLTVARSRHGELVARRARLVAELAHTAEAEAACRKDLERYTRAMVDSLGATSREGRARVKVAELEYEAVDRRVGRSRDLTDRGAGGAAELADTRDAATVAKARIDLERAGLGRTEAELEAVGQELFVTRDAPVFQLQARELAFKMPRLRADIAEVNELLKTAARAVQEEEERVRGLSDAPVRAPLAGVVWKRPGGLNQVVDRNETVLEVADQNTVFVEALIHQRYLTTVVPGCRATVCLTGGATLAGRVQAVRTSNTAEAEARYAVSLLDGDPRQVKVIIKLDEAAPDVSLIGRHVRVLISGADPDPVEQGVDWLFTRLRF